uniref:Uncharacterized protein n=1 Tax=Plectus sambesii TaxID=2011161 RepID=A0A914V6J8_9BILA
MANGTRAAQIFLTILCSSFCVISLPSNYNERPFSFLLTDSNRGYNEFKGNHLEWANLCAYLKSKEETYYFNAKHFSKANGELSTGVAIAVLSVFGFPTPTYNQRRAETADSECDTKQFFVLDSEYGKIRCSDLCMQCFPRSYAHCYRSKMNSISSMGRDCGCTYTTSHDPVYLITARRRF